jgi:endonuclease/exonuclease/phosphatase family metal-dependent hydrolase
MPYMLGEYGQCEDSMKEVVRRSILVLQTLITVPAAIVCGPLSFIPRLVGNRLKKWDFILETRRDVAQVEVISATKVRVFFLNALFLFCGFPYNHGGARPWKHRVTPLVKLIKSTNADIVFLGEMHDVKGGAVLCRKLELLGYKIFIHNIGKADIGTNSGLFVASKIDIIDVQYTPFDAAIGNAAFVKKGVLHVTAEKCNGVVQLVVTHLQYSENDFHPDPLEVEVRQKQTLVVLDACRKHAQPSVPTFIFGDFNMNQEEFGGSLLARCCVDHYPYEGATERDGTQTDYFNDRIWDPVKAQEGLQYKILDRCLRVVRFQEDGEELAFNLKTAINSSACGVIYMSGVCTPPAGPC